MLYSTKTAEQKRIDLRQTLKQGGAQQFPGAFTPLTAKLIQEKGFPGVYISGGVLANELGLPDIGLTTLTEVATRGADAVRDALPENPGEALVRRVRAQMWGPLLGGEALQFPAGMAFGAHALGFLRPGGRARLSTAGPWTRLDTPGGFVLGRPAMAV